MEKMDIDAANSMFESFATSEQQSKQATRNSTPTTRNTSHATRGVYQVTPDTSLAATVESLAREVKELRMKVDRCEICRGGDMILLSARSLVRSRSIL